MKQQIFAVALVALVALVAMAGPVLAQEPGGSEPIDIFEYLGNYEFGQSRAPLGILNEAVRSASQNPWEKQIMVQQFATMILSPDVTMDGKRYISRQLALLATPDVLPRLAPLLQDPQTADLALYILERVPGPEANAVLRDALDGDLKTEVMIGIVNVLGARGDVEAVPLLAESARSSEDELAEAAVQALGKIGDTAAREALTEIWSAGQETQQTAAGAALLRLAETLVDSGQLTLARTIYDSIYADASAVHLRAGALAGLAKVAPEETAPIVIDSFFSPQSEMRAAAAGLLRTLASEETMAGIVARLGELDDEGKVLLLNTLRDTGMRLPHDVLKKMVIEGSEPVQIAALRTIGAWGDEANVDVLLRMSIIGKGDVKSAARDSLRVLPAAGVNDYLVKIARGENSEEAVEAIQALAARSAVGAKDALMQLTGSDNAQVRAESWKALRTLGEENDVPALVALLSSAQDEAQREVAENVLASIIRRLEDRNAAAARVVEAYDQSGSEQVRASLLQVLGSVGADQALGTIEAALDAESQTVRQAAIDALAGWPNAAPLEDLKRVAQQPKSEAERASALAGIVRMLKSAELRPAALLAEYRQVMEVAATPAEKKTVLSGLSRVSTPETLQVLDQYSSDADLSAEVSAARVQVAGVLAGAYPQLVRELMEGVVAATDDEALRTQAQQVINTTKGLGDWLVAWQVSPAYFMVGQGGNMLFDDQFAPETDPDSVAWSVMPAGLDPERPYVLDLSRALGGAERMAFLRTQVTSPTAQEAVLELGSNDGIKAWVNGTVVHENNVGRPLNPNEDKIAIQLKEGVNTIMLGVYNMGGEWQATARLVGKDGKPLQGISAGIPE